MNQRLRRLDESHHIATPSARYDSYECEHGNSSGAMGAKERAVLSYMSSWSEVSRSTQGDGRLIQRRRGSECKRV